MEKELAEDVVRSSFRAMSELTSILELLKLHCLEEEVAPYRQAIGNICGRIALDLLKTVFAAHPGLEEQVDLRVKKYGKAI